MRLHSLAALPLLLAAAGALDAHPARAPRGDPYATLPAAVRETLRRRGCRPPHRPDADPAAVVTGSFFRAPARGAPASRDIAVLCFVGKKARVLVFRDGASEPVETLTFWASPSELRTQVDDTTTVTTLCDGGIFSVPASALRALVRDGTLADASRLDATERRAPVHDGFLDGDCDGVSTIHYWTGRRWVLLPGGH